MALPSSYILWCYFIDTYFFDHMHPLSPRMTTKIHFIIGTILKSITIYHSFSAYCSVNALLAVGLLKETRYTYILVPLLRQEYKSNKSLVLGNECTCHQSRCSNVWCNKKDCKHNSYVPLYHTHFKCHFKARQPSDTYSSDSHLLKVS